jgi:hypothetical protein
MSNSKEIRIEWGKEEEEAVAQYEQQVKEGAVHEILLISKD